VWGVKPVANARVVAAFVGRFRGRRRVPILSALCWLPGANRNTKSRRPATDFESSPFTLQTSPFLVFTNACAICGCRPVRSCEVLLKASGQSLGRNNIQKFSSSHTFAFCERAHDGHVPPVRRGLRRLVPSNADANPLLPPGELLHKCTPFL
jgi:hypothetical protein